MSGSRGYQIKSNDGELAYVGRCGNKIVMTPLVIGSSRQAIKIARSLIFCSSNPHLVFNARATGLRGVDSRRKTVGSISDVDTVSIPPNPELNYPRRECRKNALKQKG